MVSHALHLTLLHPLQQQKDKRTIGVHQHVQRVGPIRRAAGGKDPFKEQSKEQEYIERLSIGKEIVFLSFYNAQKRTTDSKDKWDTQEVCKVRCHPLRETKTQKDHCFKKSVYKYAGENKSIRHHALTKAAIQAIRAANNPKTRDVP